MIPATSERRNNAKYNPATNIIYVAVPPVVSLDSGPHRVIEGTNFTLPACRVLGHPAPVVTWRKTSDQLPQGRVRHNSNALQILHVRKMDSGAYFCLAVNLLGTVEKKTLIS